MTKNPALWRPNDSGTTTNPYSGYSLLLETSGYLLLETGFKLLLEDSLIAVKTPAVWSDS